MSERSQFYGGSYDQDAWLQQPCFEQRNCGACSIHVKKSHCLTPLFSYPEYFGDGSIHSWPVQMKGVNVRVHWLKHC